MKTLAVFILAAVAAGHLNDRSDMKVKTITPVLVVEEIEPVLPFWERFGFQRGPEVEHEGRLGFVILQHGDAQIMYQTRASVAADVPALADIPQAGTALFIEVDDIDAIEAMLGDLPLVVPRRTTFYGATELVLRDPAGNAVTFAQFQ